MVAWPVSLQDKFNVDNFTVKLGSTTVRSQMDVGPDKVRRRFTDAVDIYTASIDLDIEEYTDLKTFFENTLGGGSLTFSFYNPLTDTTDEFRFADPPEVRPLGGRFFRVNMTWERMP